MTYQIDVWSGNLHQHHIETVNFEEWEKASKFMFEMIEVGLLCNILHTDFKIPPERHEEAVKALIKQLEV